jgi:dihydrofolate reductase
MIKLIAAISENRVIGKDNDLIWQLPADMKFFSDQTKEHIVLMGRRNWHSIPDKYRPLPKRINIVVTRDTSFDETGCDVYHSVEKGIEAYKQDERDLYIIGGGQIYSYCLANNLVDELYITHINESFEGDTFFPEIDDTLWSKTLLFSHPIDEKNPHSFDVYHYTKNAS